MKKICTPLDVKHYFQCNERPIYFISTTSINLEGIDQWVRHFKYITYFDTFDGKHPNIILPKTRAPYPLHNQTKIANYLLQQKDIVEKIRHVGKKPVALFLMFDEFTEKLAQEIGLEIWFPAAQLRSRVENKIETVRLGKKARLPFVPHALSKVNDWHDLQKIAQKHHLGSDLVIQCGHGDSGCATFFVASEADFNLYKHQCIAEKELKIMKRINCRCGTLEACVTTSGTLVGPLLTEVIGARELTPFRGGWCGNEIFCGAFNENIRTQARDMAIRFGDILSQEGYRGYFCLDFLIDVGSNEVFVGELNARISGACALVNNAAFGHADAPLFLFHLLEFSGHPYEINVTELNARWQDPNYINSWSQLIIEHNTSQETVLKHVPPSGIYGIAEDGSIEYRRFALNRHAIQSADEALFFRISHAGDHLSEGSPIGRIIFRRRVMDDDFKLTARSLNWIEAIRQWQ